MAKPFSKPQKFLWRTQFLLFFLTAAYLMAGSLLLLQRSRLVLQQGFRGNSGNQVLPATDILLPAGDTDTRLVQNPHLIPKLIVNMDMLHGPMPDQKYGPRWLISRNSELRQLRRRWFLRFVNEQEPVQGMGAKVLKNTQENKGTYIGCFDDDPRERMMKGAVFYDLRKMTIAHCQEACAESLLKPDRSSSAWRDAEPSPPLPMMIGGEQHFEVSKILDSRIHKGRLQYLIRWKHFPLDHDEWVAHNHVHAPLLVSKFHQQYPDKPTVPV